MNDNRLDNPFGSLPRLAATACLLADGELLARFTARRDEDAFAALVARHGAMVLDVRRRALRGAQQSVH